MAIFLKVLRFLRGRYHLDIPFWLIEYYPPFWFMGVRIESITRDYRTLVASLPLRWYSKNLHGTMFGGHLCAAADPFPALMCGRIIGDLDVWSKVCSVEFKKPARSRVFMKIEITDEDIKEIRKQIETYQKATHTFRFDYRDRKGTLIAEVSNTVYLKKRARELPQAF
ncbi:MAG: DUF4442 domain-containing protein [Bdellovibrionales bacterium]|nr:DUF4442 domain-containing protein [Bdellovibrionales bacterium]